MTTARKKRHTSSVFRFRVRDLVPLVSLSYHSEYGHLMIEDKRSRVYLNMDDQVTLIKLIDGNWILTNQYQAG